MSPTLKRTVFCGSIVNPRSLSNYQALSYSLLAVSASGTIEWIVEDGVDSHIENIADLRITEILARKGFSGAEVVMLKHGEFLMPGFVDTHTHAPQVPNLGSGQEYELLQWLEHVTFPTETKFSDLDFAKRTYEEVVRRKIDCGTTTCCYYGSLHLEATKILANKVHKHGQRGFVGKCNMDRNCPESYIEPSAEASMKDTKALIEHIRSLRTSSSPIPLVYPILTPRFAICCTPELLTSLGELAKGDPMLHIQTHLSENPAEIQETKRLFPNCPTYASVYDHFGLLRENTVLAHCIHLEEEEFQLIRERDAGISHCPTSNFNLRSGVARVGEMLDRGIKVGLGTDVSGGFSPSILTTIQHASIASKVIAFSPQPKTKTSASAQEPFAGRQLPISALLYLATLGGAQVCCLADHTGNFTPGKSFDALLVNVRQGHGNPGLWGVGEADKKEKPEALLERFLFCGDDRNIKRVYVRGRMIGGTDFGKKSYEH